MSGLNLRHGLDLTKGIPVESAETKKQQDSTANSVQTAPAATKTKKSTSKK